MDDTDELPEGWATAQLTDLLDSSMNGFGKRKQDAGSPAIVLRLADIAEQQVCLGTPRRVNATDDEVSKYRLLADDLLAIRVNGSADLVGRLIRFRGADAPVLFCDHFIRLRLRTGLLPELLRLYGESPAFRWYVEVNKVSSAGQNTISQATLEQATIPLPPLAEQRRIVAAVEAVLAKVNAARERLNRVPAILKRFRQAVLSAACSGRLTADWREKHDAPEEWSTVCLRDVGAVTGGITKNARRTDLPKQVPYLRVANVYENRLELAEVLDIGVTNDEYERTKLRRGDILFVEGNGSVDQVGRVAMWDGSIAGCVHQNHLIRFRPSERVLPEYALFWMMAPEGRSQLIEQAVSSAGLHSLSISKVSEVEFELASLPEQQEIVRRLGELFALADVIETRLSDARRMADQLAQAVLAKAFRGELVPTEAELARREKRTYEPASELLARVRAARQKPAEAVSGKPKRKTRSGSKRSE